MQAMLEPALAKFGRLMAVRPCESLDLVLPNPHLPWTARPWHRRE